MFLSGSIKSAALEPVVPAGFRDERVAGGYDLPAQLQFNTPTGMGMLPDGRMLVTEKGGKLRLVQGGMALPDAVIDLSAKSSAAGDGGLIGVAPDPDFAANGYVYLLYTNNSPREGRLSRFTMSGNTIAADSEVVLLTTLADDVSHMVNTVRTGPDNTLYVSVGDSSPFDLATIGSTRSQQANVPVGKIFRVSRTGQGLPSNPFWTGNPNDAASKVFALGLRNPFRFTVRPDASVIVGDVGWNNWEEINRIPATGGNHNYGWPCYEGSDTASTVQPAFSNFPVCQALLPQGTGAVTAPAFAYNHTIGSSVTGGPVYDGTAFPAPYKNAYYFGDYTGGWLNYWPLDSAGNFVGKPLRFGTISSPVDLQMGSDGALYYISILDGQVRRISYGPQNCGQNVYTAKYYTNTTFAGEPAISRCENGIDNNWVNGGPFGAAPVDNFSVRWQGSQYFTKGTSTLSATSDDGTQVWVDGVLVLDNSGVHASTNKTVTLNYAAGSFHDVRVEFIEVSGQASASFSITSSNQAPKPVISAPATGTTYTTGQKITVSGMASDAEDGNLPATALQWNAILHHCPPPAAAGNQLVCHTHPFDTFAGTTGTLTAPDTAGDWTWVEIRLNAVDSVGTTASSSVNIYPAICPSGQFQARYYANTTWSGEPAISRCDTAINNDWGSDGPLGTYPADNFSAEWQGTQLFEAGTSTVSLTSDDGAQVWVDGKLVIDNNGYHPAVTKTASLTFAKADYHEVFVRYFEAGGEATAKFSVTSAAATSCTNGNYLANYYPNATWSGAPTITNCINSIGSDWGYGGPFAGGPVDNFGVQYKGKRYFSAGSNTLTGSSDDGMQVWVDGAMVLNHAGAHSAYPLAATITFPTAGYHDVIVNYIEQGGQASIDFTIAPTLTACPTNQYLAKYYTNVNWTGQPAIVRCETTITNDWGETGPFGVNIPDNFSVEWNGNYAFPAGASTLSVTSDDGTAVWLDNTMVIYNMAIQAPTTKTAVASYSTPGVHPIGIRYMEAAGGAVAKFSVR